MEKRGNPALKDAAGEYIEDPKTGEKKLAAAVALGSIKTEKKAAASARNGFKPGNNFAKNGGRPMRHLFELVCSCDAGDTTEGHHWDCPRARALKRRIKEGRDLLTGEKLEPSQGSEKVETK